MRQQCRQTVHPHVRGDNPPGNAIQIWSDRGPQGFQHRGHGPNDREIVDVEGVALVRQKTRVKEVAVIPEKPTAPVEEEEEFPF